MPNLEYAIDSNYVAKIRFLRIESKNAISHSFLLEFWSILKEIKNSKARILLITGSGDAFSAGADLKERASWTETDVVNFLNDFRDCLYDLENLPIPTVACINGFAFGGGLELALACDLRFACEEAIVGLTETKLGIIPGAGGTQRLTRLIGEQTAKEWIFSARKIEAKLGYQKGLYADIYPKQDFDESCMKIAEEISSSAPIAVKAAKKAINGGVEMDLIQALEWERVCYFDTIRTKDRTEALTAFKEKRKPIFIGE